MASKIGTSEIAKRYAKAFFELALEKKALTKVSKDLETLSSMLEISEDLGNMLKNPMLDNKTQIKAMTALCKEAKITVITQQLIGVLAENRRLAALSDVVGALQNEIARHQGEITAEVITATALTKTQVKALTAKLKKSLGKDIKLEESVDPELLGGMIIKIGSYMIDHSVRTKLSKLHRAMKNPVIKQEQEPKQMKEVA